MLISMVCDCRSRDSGTNWSTRPSRSCDGLFIRNLKDYANFHIFTERIHNARHTFYISIHMKSIHNHCLLLSLVFGWATTYGQTDINTAHEYRIPFVLTEYNNISVTAVVNGRDTVHLMLHTAASSVTLIEEATQRVKSITFNGTDTGVKSWGGQENSSRFSNHNSL